uniref:Ras-associating domain-containing protein n=1 Tax=Romanomermis culicivorax TaxID=13658 RepID=A0A915K540_ROMCU
MEQSSDETTATIRRRDKKQSRDFTMDHYRYSVMNMQESADVDLDALLKELCALEDQLKNGNSFPVGSSSLSPSEVEIMPNSGGVDRKLHNTANNSTRSPSTIDFYELSAQKAVHFADNHAKHCELPQTGYHPPCMMNDGARSPDNDSAFCDNMSILSVDSLHSQNLRSQHRPLAIPDCLKLSTVVDNDDDTDDFTGCRGINPMGVNRDSQGLSIDSSTRGSIMTPSPTQLLAADDDVRTFRRPPSPEAGMLKMGDDEDKEAKLKLEKIRIALEKMKEASVKKIYVKIFTCDGNSKSLLIDERLTIFDVLKILAEKNHVTLTVNHSLVEYHPDLLMERIYEDHEKFVGNILMWTTNSNNKLYFVERPVKYDIFRQPH